MERLIAIGDIHGQRNMLEDLIDQIQPTQNDQLVFLGDYCDRGPDSKGVIESLIDFQLTYPRSVFLRGNHEQMFLDCLVTCGVIEGTRLREQSSLYEWENRRDSDIVLFKNNGGVETLKSYGVEMVRDSTSGNAAPPVYVLLGELPKAHIEFIERTQLSHQQGKFVFAHAGINRHIATLEEQPIYTLLWDRELAGLAEGQTLIVGHTPVPGSEPLVSDGLIMMDTGAAYNRALSAMDVLTGKVWQAHPYKPDWLSTKFDMPVEAGPIVFLDNRTNKEIPAYFDGQDCLIGSTKTPFNKFVFWRPRKPALEDLPVENEKPDIDKQPTGKPRERLGGSDHDD